MSDPKRLLDELPRDEGLGQLLAAGRNETPNEVQLRSLAAKIGILGGIGGASSPAPIGGDGGVAATARGTAASAKGALAGKTAFALKLAGSVVAASTVAAFGLTSREEPARAPIGLVASVAEIAPQASTDGPKPADTSVASAAPSMAVTPSARASVVNSPRPSSPATADGPEVEVRLLERAQDALRSRPADALELADEHARRFPRGMLVQERDVIRIEALVKLGRENEARTRAAAFKARFPTSSHTRRIETLVGD